MFLVFGIGTDIKVALEAYEPRVVGFANDLVEQVKSFSGKPLNASLWFNYYSFDVMGQLAFGKPFDMLKNGEKHFAIELLTKGMKPIGIFSPIPWLCKQRFLFSFLFFAVLGPEDRLYHPVL
jgi:hypothetical protein